MTDTKPRGILRNRGEGSESKLETIDDHLDRQEVIRNTRINAHLASEHSEGDAIRAKIAEQGKLKGERGPEKDSQEHLKWDEINLYKTEQEKCATMKIDEPKTPYEGGFNPNGEYYKDDEEETVIPEFSLGEATIDEKNENNEESLNGGQIVVDPAFVEPKEEEHTMTAAEKHKLFEEKRKAHYHLKGNALKHPVQLSDDEE